MSDQRQVEARLSAAELEVVSASRSPAIEQASDEQLNSGATPKVSVRQSQGYWCPTETRNAWKGAAKRNQAHSTQGVRSQGPSARGGH